MDTTRVFKTVTTMSSGGVEKRGSAATVRVSALSLLVLWDCGGFRSVSHEDVVSSVVQLATCHRARASTSQIIVLKPV